VGSSTDLEIRICDLQNTIGEAEAILGQKRIAHRHALEELAASKDRYDLHWTNYRHMRFHDDLVDIKLFAATQKLLEDARDAYEDALDRVDRLVASIDYFEGEVAKMKAKLKPARIERQGFGKIYAFRRITDE
jgi:predicted metal-dependent hydrolase